MICWHCTGAKECCRGKNEGCKCACSAPPATEGEKPCGCRGPLDACKSHSIWKEFPTAPEQTEEKI